MKIRPTHEAVLSMARRLQDCSHSELYRFAQKALLVGDGLWVLYYAATNLMDDTWRTTNYFRPRVRGIGSYSGRLEFAKRRNVKPVMVL